MKIKNILKNFAMAGVFMAVFAAAAYAQAQGGTTINQRELCPLIFSLQEVFKLLRTLCFVGAAFIIMSWAWGYIKAGKIEKWDEDVKTKGIALIVGFILLFGVGMMLTFLTSTVGHTLLDCVKTGW
ncbi:MAG: hypothetical protein FWG39_00745 [Alphaproteobacteria bacterium]|nr:hypothetical protein [Alphaproteobacteria bacterium]